MMFSVEHISWGLPVILLQMLQAQNKFLTNFNLHYASATARLDSGCLCHFEFSESLSLNAFDALSLRAEGMGNSNSQTQLQNTWVYEQK